MFNPNDNIREKMMKFLYEKHRMARGPKGVSSGIRDIQKEMKKHGFKNYDVTSNLDYLIQKDWVKKVVKTRTFTTTFGLKQSEKITYKISDTGIDSFEEDPLFVRQDPISGINITSIGGITVIGSDNIVNPTNTDLLKELSQLATALNSSLSLSNNSKIAVVTDIKSIQNQLSKSKPDFTFIKNLWTGVEKIATAAGLVEFSYKISQLIK